MKMVHVLVVSFPGQGHVNPLLRLAKLLASEGLLVTFSTTESIGHMMKKATNIPGTCSATPIGQGQLRFEFFSDGWPADDNSKRQDIDGLLHRLETVGKESFTCLVKKQAEEGRPVSCLVNNAFVPWALDVATDFGIPCAVLWVQSCAVFSTYYYYFHRLARFPSVDEPHLSVHLPGLPILNSHEVPSFLHPSTIYHMLGNLILGQFQNLSKSFYVLVDSFEELEHEVIEAMSHLSLPPLRTIGPLFRSLKGSSSNSSNGVRGDFWTAAEGCIQWLDSQPLSSVVYISFGSIAFLPKDQMEEMAWGLLKTGLPFLWVVKPPAKEIATDTGLPAGFMDKAQGKGMVVEWCPQEQVLAHPSVACFVTHCGWNSSMECLTSGVPVVAFPQWGDQVTNAKFLVDKYGVGSLMGRSDRDSQLISRETVERCILEVARGPKTEEAKKNALKWKKAAEKAVANGGSSHRNIQAFVDEVRRLALTATSFEINT